MERQQEDFDTDAEYAILKREVLGGRFEQDHVPQYLARIRELLLDAQCVLAEYQRQQSEQKRAAIASEYRAVMDVYRTVTAARQLRDALDLAGEVKRMFVQRYELAKSLGDEDTMRFCEDILETFEKHHINDHIEWKR